MLRFVVCFICLLVPLAAQAELYKITNEDGSITFTDTPPYLEAKEHKLGNISSVGNPLFNMEQLNLSIPYTDENGTMIVKGKVNGVSMRFVVDTGATLVAIPPQIAKQAGLNDVASEVVTAQTANGKINVSKVSIKSIVVSRVSQSNIAATIQTISTTDPKLGLLGMSFFGQYKMTIDHTKQTIQLEKK